MRPGGRRLLAVDVDGTLVGPDMEPTPRVVRAVRRAAEAGVMVSLASGRAFGSMARYVSLLGLTAPVICFQGAEIRDAGSGSVLYQSALSRPLLEEAIAWADERDLEMTLHAGERVYLPALRREPQFYQWAFGLPVQAASDLRLAYTEPPLKFLVVGEPAQMDQVEPALRAHFAGRLQVVRSHQHFVEGVALGVSKGEALAWVAAHLGISRAQTVAVGDQENDASMLRWAGLGVAMG
ncbi:MAG: Cof-type HAD-IIB family hydrolase, partial [Chloroflexi bacterium]|nr:Cof-type HAD-IIB family hydrolase [Chloroflexota bacterium]